MPSYFLETINHHLYPSIIESVSRDMLCARFQHIPNITRATAAHLQMVIRQSSGVPKSTLETIIMPTQSAAWTTTTTMEWRKIIVKSSLKAKKKDTWAISIITCRRHGYRFESLRVTITKKANAGDKEGHAPETQQHGSEWSEYNKKISQSVNRQVSNSQGAITADSVSSNTKGSLYERKGHQHRVARRQSAW